MNYLGYRGSRGGGGVENELPPRKDKVLGQCAGAPRRAVTNVRAEIYAQVLIMRMAISPIIRQISRRQPIAPRALLEVPQHTST